MGRCFVLSKISVLRYVLIISAALTAPQAMAGEMTLRQGVAQALQHNRGLAASEAGVHRAEAEADAALGRMLPRVDMSTGVARTDSPLGYFGAKLQQARITTADFIPSSLNRPGYINNYQTRLGLSMPVFAGGALWAGRARARHHADASALNYEFGRQQLIYQTIVAYIQARQTAAQVEARANAVQAARKRWQDARALHKRGMAINSDVMDAHVHLLRSEVALDQARDAHAASMESLSLVLGRETLKDRLVEPSLDLVAGLKGGSLQALVDRALEQRADLRAMLEELDAARAARRQSRAGYLPQVSLVAAQEWNSETFGLKNRNTMIGATVSMNLFAGGADKARIRAAESDLLSLEYRLADKQQQIANQVRQAWRSMRTAERRYQSDREALRQTEESLRIKTLRHRQGLEKTSDVLDAQVRLDTSRVANIRARYDVMIARAALMLAAGALNEEVVQ